MTNTPRIIGVCLSMLPEEYRLQCVRALNKYAVQQGYRLFIFHSKTDFYLPLTPTDDGEMSIFQLIQYHMLDAMIVLPDTIKRDSVLQSIIDSCRSHNVPIISIDKFLEGCVNFRFDYSNSFEMLCQHVVQKHHAKRLFMMAGMRDNTFSDERIHAFEKVMAENNITPDNYRIGYGDFWEKPTRETLEQWFIEEQCAIPDAIICANDTMAIVCSQFLQNHGHRIPEDCIVTGFDGISEANYHVPHITTCTQDYDNMGKEVIAAAIRLHQGLPVEPTRIIDFHILYSQSCGCEKPAPLNINNAMQDIADQLKRANERQELTCQVQSTVTSMTSLAELPEIIQDKFIFESMVFALNDDIFRAPDFGERHRNGEPFSEQVNVMYHRYFWVPQDACITPLEQLIPDLSTMLRREDPVIFCPLHFLDLVMGYCAFQTDISHDSYEKINSFMNAMNSSLGIFHSQVHTKSINMQLKSANSELEKLYVHDHMTGLLNRRGFYRQFHQQLKESSEKNMSIVIISADLDGLKHINDTFGHTEGDNAITTVGKALVSSAIQGEVCSRFGGDEFTVAGVIADSDSCYFDSFRFRFREYLHRYNSISHKPYQVESSIGFCIQPMDKNVDLDQMIKVADDRMYEDKIQRRKARK
ncbi:diguanylate cyclase domain-containing protein [Ruminococcus sp.]